MGQFIGWTILSVYLLVGLVGGMYKFLEADEAHGNSEELSASQRLIASVVMVVLIAVVFGILAGACLLIKG